MAMFPCSICGSRYSGRQQTAFFHVVENGTDLGGKLRLCPGHFDMVEDFLMKHTLCTAVGDEPVEFAVDEPSPLCAECDDPNPTASIFAYTFATNFPKRQFWGRVCHGCAPETLKRVKMTT